MTARGLRFPSLATVDRMPAQVFLVIAFVALCIIFAIFATNFATGGNVINILRQSSSLFMLAAGQTLVILLAGIDLSQGSVVALVSIITAMTMKGLGVPIGILAGLLIGASCGLVSGLLVAKARVESFIVSLGMLFSVYGMTYIISRNPIFGLPESFFVVGEGMVGGIIPVPVILFALVAFTLYRLLRQTSFGRCIYAIGGNQEAAWLSGVAIDRIKIYAWTLNGFLIALASIILTSRVGSGQPLLGGLPLLMQSISAVFIGGTSFFGGKGSILGTLIGVLFIAVLVNGLTLMGINQFLREVALGVLILIAVWAGTKGR